MRSDRIRARLGLILSMSIFGTIGIFRRDLPLPSGVIAFARGVIGTLFLVLLVMVTKKGVSWQRIRGNLPKLLISGGLIGLNWVLLFEAYRYTSVATATLCYYMAPIFVIAASPFVLRERMTAKQGACVAVALVGMVAVSGVLEGGEIALRGVLFGLSAAVLYASVVLINKTLGEIAAYDKTIVQLAAASLVIFPYILLVESVDFAAFTPFVCIVLLVVGVIHTGAAYALYFGSMGALEARSVALLSYLDPIVAIVLSAFLLGEMKKRGLKPIITSDCHSARNIDFGYDIAKRVLREAGFSEQYILTREGFCAVAL